MTQPALASNEFDLLRTQAIPSLRIELQEFRHRRTGALHLHLQADDNQNAFLVAFRTVPMDSTGVAHILEHTALCGSQRFPVRDPFFMMTRRSLNTFMNAFTSSDWTAYPFASCNRKDFDNLMQVYLDAAFFPTLDRMDFAQEGHRVEFEQPGDPNTPLLFKGVVFNEMKGAMSSPVSALWQTLTEHLFPTTTYHYNSGGDPAHIPDLSHEELLAFHARHYHPGNAVFMTYGDIPAAEHQAVFERDALARFGAATGEPIRVGEERRLSEPLCVETTYALDGEEDESGKTHIALGWLLGRNTDMEEVLTANLLSGVLLDNSASPLRHALETTDLGQAPSPLCGLQDSTYEMVFGCGLEGSEPERAEAVEALVFDTLHRVAKEGVPIGQVEAMLHQLELSQREISGDGYPYGLQLMLHALTPAIHDADAAAALDIDPILERLRTRIQDPGYIPGLVRRMLLDNPHRVRLTMRPDTGLSAKRAEHERDRLAALKSAMDEAARAQVVAQAEALKRRQEQEDNPDLLPRVTLADIPADLPIPIGQEARAGGMPAALYTRGTNGLVYQQVVVELPAFPDEVTDLLPLYCDMLTEVGCGGRDYLETQSLQAAVTGGLSANLSVRGALEDVHAQRAFFVLSGKALARNQGRLSDLMRETFTAPRFDEADRLRELTSQERLYREEGVTHRGHRLAMIAAAAGFTPTSALDHRWGGLAHIQYLKALDDGLEGEAEMERLRAGFEAIQAALAAAPRRVLLIGEEEHLAAVQTGVDQAWAGHAGPTSGTTFSPAEGLGPVRQAWATSTQVNFCAKAYGCIHPDHPDAAALIVLAPFLRNNFLHRAIREQGGAYGGGASFDPDTGTFRFYSYRDPRLADTLADFDRSLEWLASGRHEPRLLEEAILGVIADIDKPGSPAGEAKRAFHNALHGRTPERRRAYRKRLLDVTLKDLRDVATRYLDPARASVAVVSSPATLAKADLGLAVIAL